ncbi:uncharacterized protein LOC135681437 [Rhopilema esculentum]|uniref:uncharacterized protein LOC135681437 n=1 Tax=Rhopilema esculentum TaxID=499914 RepID=UPI0031D5605F
MLGNIAAKEQLGESRCRALVYLRTYLKFLLMALPVAAVGLSFPFDNVAYIHQVNDSAWFNLTVKFPFHYGQDTVFYTNETIPAEFQFDKEIEICSWLFFGINVVWFIMAFAILLTYVSVHGGEKMEKAATTDGFISCSMALIGATLTGIWLYNVINLRKLVFGQVNFVYNGPSQCLRGNYCIKSLPDFLTLYIAAGIGFFASLCWGINIFVALKFTSKYHRAGNFAWNLEMSTEHPDDFQQQH